MNKVKYQILLNDCKKCKYSSATIHDEVWCLCNRQGVNLHFLRTAIKECKGLWFKPLKRTTK